MKRRQSGPLVVAAASRAKGSATGQGASPTSTEQHLLGKCKPPALVKWALAAYTAGILTTELIALTIGVSLATITVWAKEAGITLRKRGRRVSLSPRPRVGEIVLAARSRPQAEVARSFAVSRQAVSRAVKRWENWPGVFARSGLGKSRSSLFLETLWPCTPLEGAVNLSVSGGGQ